MHESVLLNEAIEALDINADGIYVDGTFGRGGHSAEILKALSDSGQLLGFDKDQYAHEHAHKTFAADLRLSMQHASFGEMRNVVDGLSLLGKVSGILLDLGVSSPQLDDANRGFSFLRDGPLDMRMDNSQGQTAAQWINSAEQKKISEVLRKYGDEKWAALIAKRIVERRKDEIFDIVNVKFWLNFRVGNIIKCKNTK